MSRPRYQLVNDRRGWIGPAYNDRRRAELELARAIPRADWRIADRRPGDPAEELAAPEEEE